MTEYLTEKTADEVIKKLTRAQLDDQDAKFLYETIYNFALNGTYTDLDNISYVLSNFSKPKYKEVLNKIIKKLCASATKEYQIDEDHTNSVSSHYIIPLNICVFIG